MSKLLEKFVILLNPLTQRQGVIKKQLLKVTENKTRENYYCHDI